MKKTSLLKFLINLNNQSGIAILMVITAVTLLALVLADFTFETNINKIKVYNKQDKVQAKLNAEAGIKFALAKLRLYKQGYNLLEKNKNAKSFVNPSALESIITQPFMFPIPIPEDADLIQKEALAEFVENTMIQGDLSVIMNSVSGFLNPNNLRIPKVNHERSTDGDESENEIHKFIEEKLISTLRDSFEQKRETDEIFDSLYGNLDPELLIKELKFFVNDRNAYVEPEAAEFEALYSEKDMIPKHAPLTSISELHLLAGWNDAIIDLIKDRLTVHEVSIIPVNQITNSQLKVLFPDITKEQSEEFFKYRDGSQGAESEEDESNPNPFESEEGFKNIIVNELHIVDEQTFDDRMEDLKKAGIQIGVAGKLFRIISKGTYGRSEHTITAYVDLPIKPQPPKKKKKDKKDDKKTTDPDNPEENPPLDPDKNEEEKKEKAPPTELLEPRIIEININ